VSAITVVSLLNISAASESLPIRNRTQWLENNGYCGETSLQECALYFGIYASQAWIRNVIDPTQANDLVELEEWAKVLPALGLKAEYFPTDQIEAPQYKAFEIWAKQQLARKRPVITTCYLPFGSLDPVDHIITLTGFSSDQICSFSDTDSFTFTHHLAQTTSGLPGAPFSFHQQARWLFDDRSMSGPGAIYGYAIQKEVNYALAVVGTGNTSPQARPVRVELDRITEPNVVGGESPEPLQAEITIEDLAPGRAYVLYQYDNPAKVPINRYAFKPCSRQIHFKATDTTHRLQETIPSNGVAVFRCLPIGY
jgi:hypothetical protein